MSRRAEQVSSLLRRAVQSVLAEGLSDPRLEGVLLSVTDVTVSDDLRTATVKVSVLPDTRESAAMHALRTATRHVRREAGDRTALRKLPELTFKLDRSLKKQAAVLDALSRVRAERGDENDHAEASTPTPRHDAHGAPGAAGAESDDTHGEQIS